MDSGRQRVGQALWRRLFRQRDKPVVADGLVPRHAPGSEVLPLRLHWHVVADWPRDQNVLHVAQSKRGRHICPGENRGAFYGTARDAQHDLSGPIWLHRRFCRRAVLPPRRHRVERGSGIYLEVSALVILATDTELTARVRELPITLDKLLVCTRPERGVERPAA